MPPTESRRLHNLEKTYESKLQKLEELRGLVATAAFVGLMLALIDLAMCIQLGEKVYVPSKQPHQQTVQAPR